MSRRLTRKEMLAGLAAGAAGAATSARAAGRQDFLSPSTSGETVAAKVERDPQGRIVKWVGADGRSYAVEYRNDFPALRTDDYPGVAAWAFSTVTAVGAGGVRNVAFTGFAWGPDRKAPAHAAAGNPARGVFIQKGFDFDAAIARAARGRLRALHLWTEQDFLRGVEDALKINPAR